MQNERGTQHGMSCRTPLPLFRAVSIFCLSVAIFSTSLRLGFGQSLPPAGGLSGRMGAADKRRLRLPAWGRALDCFQFTGAPVLITTPAAIGHQPATACSSA